MDRLPLALLLLAAALSAMATPDPPRPAAQVVRETCALCHAEGVGGAPRIGSAREWRPRLRAGLDGLLRSASQGKGAMPARGGVPDLTDAELRAAIAYMAGLQDEERRGP
jgi:cytochrome c5